MASEDSKWGSSSRHQLARDLGVYENELFGYYDLGNPVEQCKDDCFRKAYMKKNGDDPALTNLP